MDQKRNLEVTLDTVLEPISDEQCFVKTMEEIVNSSGN